MKLSDAGQKVWESHYHAAYNYQDYAVKGVPFGWVVAKDCLQGLMGARPVGSEDATLAINQAIALCNALAKEGL